MDVQLFRNHKIEKKKEDNACLIGKGINYQLLKNQLVFCELWSPLITNLCFSFPSQPIMFFKFRGTPIYYYFYFSCFFSLCFFLFPKLPSSLSLSLFYSITIYTPQKSFPSIFYSQNFLSLLGIRLYHYHYHHVYVFNL